MKKKIDLIIGSLIRGGAEHVISILANHYAELDYDVNILLLFHGAIDFEIDSRVKIIHLHGTKIQRIKKVPYWIKSLKAHFIERKPDIVVSFVCRINLLVLHSLKKCSKQIGKPRIILSERNDPRYDGRGVVAKLLSRKLYKYADSIIFQSVEVRSQFPKRIRDKGCIVLNPIEVEKVYVEPLKRDKTFIMTGRLVKQKNQMLLIKAFEKSLQNKALDGYVLKLFGYGELTDRYKAYVNKHNLSDRILIEYNTPDAQKEVARSRCFVLSSLFEGLSNSLMEAIALGIPSISTPVSGSSTIINDKNGILLKTFKVDELMEAIIKIASLDDKQYIEMSKTALAESEKFNQESILEKFDSIILKDQSF